MIIKDIIFIHAPKCAGHSMEKLLLDNFNKNIFESMKYILHTEVSENFKKVNKKKLDNNFFSCINKYVDIGKGIHENLNDYSKNVDINQYKIIFMARHPLDKLISSYNYCNPGISFDEFARAIIYRNKEKYSFIHPWLFDEFCDKQFDYISINGRVPDNLYIIKLENQEEAKIILGYLGLEKVNLPHENISSKNKFVISQETLDLIEKSYEIDFKCFNYKMEDAVYFKNLK